MRYLPISMHPSYDSQTHRFFTRLDETTMTIPLPASRLGLILGLSSVLLLPHGAMAQSIDPGLWEMRSTMDMADQPGMAAQLQEMQEALKNLSPEERKMMEQQMGGQGVGIGPGGAVRICISAQDAQSLQRWQQWPELPAVAHQQLKLSQPDRLQRLTLRTVAGIEELCQLIDQAR